MANPSVPIESLPEAIPPNLCAQMVDAAAKSCQPAAAPPPVAESGVADSLAALSTAFTFGSILLAIVVLLAGFAWGKIVAASAEKEAKKAAKECAEAYIQDWLSKEAPGIIRRRVDFILDATLGDGDDAAAADEIGKEA